MSSPLMPRLLDEFLNFFDALQASSLVPDYASALDGFSRGFELGLDQKNHIAAGFNNAKNCRQNKRERYKTYITDCQSGRGLKINWL